MALDRRPLTPTPVFCHHEQARVHLLDRLMWSQLFEQFLQTKFPTAKRFGLEGCESLIPGLKHLIDSSAVNGVDSIVMGMPHRGRLNVLCNVVRKPLEAVFKEFSPPGTHPHARAHFKCCEMGLGMASASDWSSFSLLLSLYELLPPSALRVRVQRSTGIWSTTRARATSSTISGRRSSGRCGGRTTRCPSRSVPTRRTWRRSTRSSSAPSAPSTTTRRTRSRRLALCCTATPPLPARVSSTKASTSRGCLTTPPEGTWSSVVVCVCFLLPPFPSHFRFSPAYLLRARF